MGYPDPIPPQPQFGQQQNQQQPFAQSQFGQPQNQQQPFAQSQFGQQQNQQQQFQPQFGQQQQQPIDHAFGAQTQTQFGNTNTVNFGGGFNNNGRYNNSGNNNQIIDVPADIEDLMENGETAKTWNTSLGKLPDAFFECLKGKNMTAGSIDTSALAKDILTKIGTTTLNAETKLFTLNSVRQGRLSTEYRLEAQSRGTLCELLTKYCTYALTGKEPSSFETIFKEVFADTLIYTSKGYDPKRPYKDYEQAAAEYKKILSNTEPALEMPKEPTGGKLDTLGPINLNSLTYINTVPEIVYVLNQTLNKISYEKFKEIYENVNSGSDTTLANIRQLPYYILALKFQAAINGKPLIIQSKSVVQLQIANIKQNLSEKYKNLKLELKKKEEDELKNRAALVIKHSANKSRKSSTVNKILDNIIEDLKTNKFPSSSLEYFKNDYAGRAIRKAYKIDNVPGLTNLLEYIKSYDYKGKIEPAKKLAQEKCNPKKYGYSAYGINLIITTLFNFDLCRKKYLSSDTFEPEKVKAAYESIKNLHTTINNLKQKSHKTPTITQTTPISQIKQIPVLIKNMEKKLIAITSSKNVYDLIQ